MTERNETLSNRIPLDDEVARLIAETPSQVTTDETSTLDELRADGNRLFAWMRGQLDPVLAHIPTRDKEIDGVPVRWYGAEPRADRHIIVFAHGGGWILGDLQSHDDDARLLVHLTGATVVAVDYRLAPEHPFPAAIEDCVSVTLRVAELPHRGLGIVGDSAGGNLAIATAVAVRSTDVLDAVLALYPVVDPEGFGNDSYAANGVDYLLTTEAMQVYWEMYATTPDSRREPRVALTYADLRGLPPTVISTADYDPLRDEGRELAARLVQADVDVTFLPHPGLIHGFQQMTPRIPAATRATEQSYAAFMLALGRSVASRTAAASSVRS
jgi:acetyl esterase